MEIAQYGTARGRRWRWLFAGRELQHGFKIWRNSRNREVLCRPTED